MRLVRIYLSPTLLLLVILYFQQKNIWGQVFFKTGLPLILYQFARLAYSAVLLDVLFRLGSWINRSRQTQNLIDDFFIGVAALSLAGSVLGYIGGLNLYVLTPLFLALLLVDPKPYLIIKPLSLYNLSVILVAFYAFVSRSLTPDLTTVDTLGHYLPYIKSVIESGRLPWPSPFYFDFFFLKGAGLQLISAIFTDQNSTSLISCLCFTGIAGLLYRWCTELFKDLPLKILPSLFTILFILSPFSLAFEFQKIHMTVGALFLFFIDRLARRDLHLGKSLSIAAMALANLNPSFSPFLFISFFFLCSLEYRDRRIAHLKRVLVIGSLTLTIVLLNLLTNYLRTGVAEVTPLAASINLSSRKLEPPTLSLWVERYLSYEEGSQPLKRPDLPFIFYISFLLLISALSAKSFSKSWTEPLFRLLAVVRISTLILGLFLSQGSFFRGLTFCPPIDIMMAAFSVHFLLKKKPLLHTLVKATLVFLIGVFTIKVHTSDLLHWPFLSLGTKSFGAFYGFSEDDPCTQARRFLGDDVRITLLHFIPSCVGKPTDYTDSIDPAEYIIDGKIALLAQPSDAAQQLNMLGASHFLFIPGQTLYTYAFFPLFYPQNLSKYFRVEKVLTHGYLFSWRISPTDQIPKKIMTLYAEQWSADQKSPNLKFVKKWINSRSNF